MEEGEITLSHHAPYTLGILKSCYLVRMNYPQKHVLRLQLACNKLESPGNGELVPKSYTYRSNCEDDHV